MNKIIADAENLLSDVCKQYQCHDKDIMQGVEGEKLHALDVLAWVEKLAKKPSVALKLAALFHDIDRIVTPKAGGGFKGKRNSKEYFQHKKRHAARSANFIIPLLKKIAVSDNILKKTKFLILHHDDTGEEIVKLKNSDLNYLVAADSFAFFTSIAPKLYEIEGEEKIKDKIKFMTEKMPEFARIKLWKHSLENKIFNEIKNEIIQNYYAKHKNRFSF